MNRKIKILYDKIFEDFTRGKIGPPHIPTQKEVLFRIRSLTADDYSAIAKDLKLDDIDINEIHENFSRIVDDIDVLYRSIEDESTDVLEQLTNSLKEHNGIKRELKNINERALDIQSGKLGKDYLKYVHSQTFTSLDDINIAKTTTDVDTQAPVIDIKAGKMYIPNSTQNIVDLSHYNRSKVDIINTDFIGTIIEAGYIGQSDAGTMLNPNDTRRLVYRAQTNIPTAMKSSFVIKLQADGKKLDVNAVVLNIDTTNTNGHLRIFYRTDIGWVDVPAMGVKALEYDRNVFRFDPVNTSHLKFQFIKESPDIMSTLEYFITIYDLAIIHAYTHKTSTLYSKSIKINSYSTENPVIGRISASTDAIVPPGCSVNISVARDKLVKGYFVDNNGNWVDPTSINVQNIIYDDENLYPERHILLSNVKEHPDISGLSEEFSNVDFDWIEIKTLDEFDNNRPKVLEFNGTIKKDPFDNSLYQGPDYYKFGDVRYSGTYPQTGHPEAPFDLWFLSGVVQESNPYWSYMEPLVNSGLIASGADFGDPTGYPLNYYNSDLERVWLFGDYTSVTNGWWRPASELVTPTGIFTIDDFDPYPDFYVNENRYYTVYKFDSNTLPIESTIKLYTYETRPVEDDSNEYPHNFIWNYRTKQVNNSKTLSSNTYDISDFSNGILVIPPVPLPVATGVIYLPIVSGETYIPGSVRDVSYEFHNNSLELGTNYLVKGYDTDLPYLDFAISSNVSQKLSDEKVVLTYSVYTEEKYTSFWESYLLVDLDSSISITQQLVDNEKLIRRILLTNINTSESTEYEMTEEQLRIDLVQGIYNIKLFCLSDSATTYCKDLDWNPATDKVIKGANIRCVATIEPMRIVDFNLLLFSTTYERDNRAALITDSNGFSYIVVKEPSKKLIRGYYFDASVNSYKRKVTDLIPNTGHYKRKYNGESISEEYITGSQQSNIIINTFESTFSGIIPNNDPTLDEGWNRGRIWPANFHNTDPYKMYMVHSTYGNPITLDDYGLGDFSINNAGHLFYNTGENLPAFYTMEYGSVNITDPTKDRFLYRIDLLSEHEVNTPIVNSVKFVINGDLEDET